ncbi:hypothetical protein FRC00_009163, partial [Tulasnella sp. 408]
MLGSTLLSAATALFFLPSVFSAPVAPVVAINSVSVPEVHTTIISTTRRVAIQKVTAVCAQKKAELSSVLDSVVAYKATADSKVDLEWAQGICGHVSGILTDTVTAVQSASTSPVDLVAVDVDIVALLKVLHVVESLVSGILHAVGAVLAEVTGIVDIIKVLVAWDVRGIHTLIAYLAVP